MKTGNVIISEIDAILKNASEIVEGGATVEPKTDDAKPSVEKKEDEKKEEVKEEDAKEETKKEETPACEKVAVNIVQYKVAQLMGIDQFFKVESGGIGLSKTASDLLGSSSDIEIAKQALDAAFAVQRECAETYNEAELYKAAALLVYKEAGVAEDKIEKIASMTSEEYLNS